MSFEASCEIGAEQTSVSLAVTRCPPGTTRPEAAWAVQARAGIRHRLDPTGLLLDLTWHEGLTGGEGPAPIGELRNRALPVTAGLSVALG